MTKDKAIVLKATPYKEKDIIVLLFSLENGLISAVLRGVKSPNSKFKFAAMPFCFADFEFTAGKGLPIIVGVSLIEDFYDITQNIDVFFNAGKVLKIISFFTSFGEVGSNIFVLCLKTLNVFEITAKLKDVKKAFITSHIILIKFLLEIFDLTGNPLILKNCSKCDCELIDFCQFDYNSGLAYCEKCNSYLPKISKQVISFLSLIKNSEWSMVGKLFCNESCLNESLNIVLAFLEKKLGLKLN